MCVIKARTHECVQNTHSTGVIGSHSRLRGSCNQVTQSRAFHCHFAHSRALSLFYMYMYIYTYKVFHICFSGRSMFWDRITFTARIGSIVPLESNGSLVQSANPYRDFTPHADIWRLWCAFIFRQKSKIMNLAYFLDKAEHRTSVY